MRPSEYETIRALQEAAFGGDESIGTLIDLLLASWAWEDELSWVAEVAGELIGHALFTHAIVDAPARIVDVLVLGPVGVEPEWHGRGVGTVLISEAIRAVGDRPEPAIFIEGDPAFYSRFGFRPGASLGFAKPSERIPDAAFMAMLLTNHEPWITGRLVYPDAFWRTDSVGLR